MDRKTVAAAAVIAVLVVAGAEAYVLVSEENHGRDEYDSGAFNIIARANSEGTGLYIEASLLAVDADGIPLFPCARASNGAQFFDSDYNVTTANGAAWGGLILGDPGVSSIQHTQLAQIASDAGLDFKQYTVGLALSDDTLYYVTNLSNAGAIANDTDIQGGIIWEPQYQKVIQENGKYTGLALTNDMFSGHTCCVVAANHDWLVSDPDVAAAFLAGYAEAVDFIVQALGAGEGSADYEWLMELAEEKTQGLTEEEIAAAFGNITYLYADGANGALGGLESDVAALARDLYDLGLITNKGFDRDDADALAAKLVDDEYMTKAVAGDFDPPSSASVRVANINGDIHEIAVHVAVAKGYFDRYNLTVTVNSSSSSGGDIATLLESGDANIGFLGAPPATLKTINGQHIEVRR